MIGCPELDYSVKKWAWSETHLHALFGDMTFAELTFGEMAFGNLTFGEVLGNPIAHHNPTLQIPTATLMFSNSVKWQREYRKRVSDGPWRAQRNDIIRRIDLWQSDNWRSDLHRNDTKFRWNIVIYFIIWTSFRLCTV